MLQEAGSGSVSRIVAVGFSWRHIIKLCKLKIANTNNNNHNAYAATIIFKNKNNGVFCFGLCSAMWFGNACCLLGKASCVRRFVRQGVFCSAFCSDMVNIRTSVRRFVRAADWRRRVFVHLLGLPKSVRADVGVVLAIFMLRV